jgi:catechol 2,3-dioxygenase-like lactoylglutathione lyase family enzyme
MEGMDFSYVRLLVVDYAACFRFYRDMMGLDVKLGDERSGYAELQTGNVTIALFGRQAMAQVVNNADVPVDSQAQDRFVVIFAVADVDAAYNALQQRGIVFITPPTDRPDWNIRTAHFRDPDGNLIEINRRLS